MSSPVVPDSIRGLSAVVTGGSRGLGLLLADQLAAWRCAVTVAARDEEELARAGELLRRRPAASVRTVVCDVRDREAVRNLFQDTARECGGVDVVMANAGIIDVAPVDAVGAAEFDAAMDTVFKGALHTSLEALPYLRESRAGGRLALIDSVAGILSAAHLLPYACAKAAVAALAEGLHAEAAGDGVSVTAVHPGLMRTGSHVHTELAGDKRQEFAWFSALSGTPLLSMDVQRAAERIVEGVQRRRTRIVLTPGARAADLAHGVAPGLTTRLTTLSNRVLPNTGGDTGDDTEGARQGGTVTSSLSNHPVVSKLRGWGSALNDRAARAYHERQEQAGKSGRPG